VGMPIAGHEFCKKLTVPVLLFSLLFSFCVHVYRSIFAATAFDGIVKGPSVDAKMSFYELSHIILEEF